MNDERSVDANGEPLLEPEFEPKVAPAMVATTASTAGPDRLGVLLDIDLPLLVRFGSAELPLKTLVRLGPGALIDLSRRPEDPVEMLVGDRVVARGEVVVVAGSYGIRVLEVVGARVAASGADEVLTEVPA